MAHEAAGRGKLPVGNEQVPHSHQVEEMARQQRVKGLARCADAHRHVVAPKNQRAVPGSAWEPPHRREIGRQILNAGVRPAGRQ